MKVSLWKIFCAFAKIGAFTIGGGYVMVPTIEAQMRRQHWIDDDTLADIVAISQSAPGLLTVNMAIFSGYRLRGIWGGVVATAGCLLAPVLIILGIAMFLGNFSDSPVVMKIFAGVRPVAVALIAGYFLRLVRRNSKPWQLVLTFVVMMLMVLLKVSAVYIILATIVISAAVCYFRQGRAVK